MTKAAAKKKRLDSAARTGFGILNRFGNMMWSPHVFDTPEAAREHFDAFWRQPGFEQAKVSFRDYRIVRAKQTTRYVGEVARAQPEKRR